jgi:hypothetical protein
VSTSHDREIKDTPKRQKLVDGSDFLPSAEVRAQNSTVLHKRRKFITLFAYMCQLYVHFLRIYGTGAK